MPSGPQLRSACYKGQQPGRGRRLSSSPSKTVEPPVLSPQNCHIAYDRWPKRKSTGGSPLRLNSSKSPISRSFKAWKILLLCLVAFAKHLNTPNSAAAESPGSATPARQAMVDRKELNLVPPLVEAGDSDALLKAGQRLFTTWSPANNALAIAVTSVVCPHG